jgi:Ca2+-binding EF-hand superfamily protein
MSKPSAEDVKKVFAAIDKDGNGTVSPNELYDALGKNNFRTDEIALLIAQLDKSGDGKIDIKGGKKKKF